MKKKKEMLIFGLFLSITLLAVNALAQSPVDYCDEKPQKVRDIAFSGISFRQITLSEAGGPNTYIMASISVYENGSTVLDPESPIEVYFDSEVDKDSYDSQTAFNPLDRSLIFPLQGGGSYGIKTSFRSFVKNKPLHIILDPNNKYIESKESNNIITCTSFEKTYSLFPQISKEELSQGYTGVCYYYVPEYKTPGDPYGTPSDPYGDSEPTDPYGNSEPEDPYGTN